MTEERVTPSRMVPVRAGVRTVPSDPTTKMFMPPSSSSTVLVAASRKHTCSHPCAAASSWGSSEAA